MCASSACEGLLQMPRAHAAMSIPTAVMQCDQFALEGRTSSILPQQADPSFPRPSEPRSKSKSEKVCWVCFGGVSGLSSGTSWVIFLT